MTFDRLLQVPAGPDDLAEYLRSSLQSSRLHRELEIGNVHFDSALDYVKCRQSSATARTRFASAFEAGTPGVLSLMEVQDQVELDRWKLRIGGAMMRLEVSTFSV